MLIKLAIDASLGGVRNTKEKKKDFKKLENMKQDLARKKYLPMAEGKTNQIEKE